MARCENSNQSFACCPVPNAGWLCRLLNHSPPLGSAKCKYTSALGSKCEQDTVQSCFLLLQKQKVKYIQTECRCKLSRCTIQFYTQPQCIQPK